VKVDELYRHEGYKVLGSVKSIIMNVLCYELRLFTYRLSFSIHLAHSHNIPILVLSPLTFALWVLLVSVRFLI
jgi:hypothetical protein